jgi:hypothetical protein
MTVLQFTEGNKFLPNEKRRMRLDPVGMDGVLVMESSYTGTIKQTTIMDGTLIQNPTVQPGPYIQGDGGAPPTVVGSP